MNNDRTEPLSCTLGGIFMSPQERENYKDVVMWGGNIFQSRKPNNFGKRRTFITEWESAVNNNGVFVNK